MNRRQPSLLLVLCSLAAGSALAQSEGAPLRPMIQVQPAYPESAVEQGIQGYVELDVTVGEQGTVERVAIVSSVPEGVFDESARNAVLRWRYPPEPGRPPQSVVERIEFRVPVVPTIPSRGAAAAAVSASFGAGPRNACVREQSKFTYGDRVDVVLINACDVPLVIASCVSGTRQYRGQWECTTTERAGTLLVPENDPRVGETTLVDGDAVELTFTDRLVLHRAPNSEYWWVACTLADASCREDASVWVRSLHGQPASADPQVRSAVTLARSY
ncbi:MAG TPA: energy transducer TonB [Gammaproteobacteria bacterium]